MPYYESPKSDVARLAFLRKARETAATDQTAGNNYLFPETMTELDTVFTQFNEKMSAVSDTLGQRGAEVAEANAARMQLEMYVRDLWEMLRRRVRRHNEPVSVLAFYQLNQDGSAPNPSGREEWLTIAQQAVDGDAKAVAAGHPAAVCPSAAEVDAVLQTAIKESGDVTGADRAYDQAQQAVADLRPTVDALIQEVVEQLRFNLRKDSASGQRRVQRTYGATFRYLKGEPVDPDDTQPPTE